jgi:hypothetical protein
MGTAATETVLDQNRRFLGVHKGGATGFAYNVNPE